MGTWGVGLYQDDVTCDIKEEYLNRLRIGYSNIEATQEVIDYNMDSIEDEEEGPLFWFALADIQWRYGRLLLEVKEEALRCIKSGEDLERWKENPQQYKKRKLVLEELEERLNSPQPPEKKLAKLKVHKADWEIGDVLLYQIKNGDLRNNEEVKNSKWYNKYILLRIVGITKTNIGSLPREYSNERNIAKIYNWVGSEAPNIKDIDRLEFIADAYGKFEDAMFTLRFNERELKKLNFITIMKDSQYEKPSERITRGLGIPWVHIYVMDYMFIRTLKLAEENGTLIDETCE